jgi:S-formylglutathione hydrolase FrmB
VILDPDCPLGHHAFADSENNGPWGKSLIEEVIPAIEGHYRCIPQSNARFLTGHSSGGWSSLWLQVNYPDVFGGVWSTAPDPVDFRSFHNLNIYDPNTNVFRDENGAARLLERALPKKFFYQDFSSKEVVIGPGGQLGSFEAVFSPAEGYGQPKKLWNRQSGKITAEVVNAWKKYDIGLIIQNRWSTIGPKLKAKIHIYVGDQDLFYLDKPVELLKSILDSLDANAEVKIIKGYDHYSLINSKSLKNINREIDKAFVNNFSQ